MQVVEAETIDYGANSIGPSVDFGSCCRENCDSPFPWERVEDNPCNLTLFVPKRMEPPIYMYYKLTNYYQNHRRYVRSRDDKQLQGEAIVGISDLESSCQYHFRSGFDVINP